MPLAAFRTAYDIPEDVDIAYCHEGDITLQRRAGPNVAFFPLMAILKGGVRFPVNPIIIGPLDFMACVSTNFLPIFTEW